MGISKACQSLAMHCQIIGVVQSMPRHYPSPTILVAVPGQEKTSDSAYKLSSTTLMQCYNSPISEDPTFHQNVDLFIQNPVRRPLLSLDIQGDT